LIYIVFDFEYKKIVLSHSLNHTYIGESESTVDTNTLFTQSGISQTLFMFFILVSESNTSSFAKVIIILLKLFHEIIVDVNSSSISFSLYHFAYNSTFFINGLVKS
jgi:hypothetical protein